MAAVVSYKVGVTRSHKPGPVRWLSLKLESASEGAQAVSLFFYGDDAPALGFLNRDTGMVVANLPIADFEPTYRILNTEKPVFVHFRVHGDGNRLLSLDVSTSEEPIGEGPVDTSP
jgi:hypothetical protein